MLLFLSALLSHSWYESHMCSGCHSVDFVRKRLEKEIDALRSARGTLEDTGGEGDAAPASAVIQCPQPFSFAGAGIGLTCGGISVLRNDLSAVNSFVNTLR
jgi:signal recognition particle receptor subunit beta